MLRGKCPNCPNTYPLDPSQHGKRAKCNSCGHVFTVEATSVDAPTDHEAASETDPLTAERQRPPDANTETDRGVTGAASQSHRPPAPTAMRAHRVAKGKELSLRARVDIFLVVVFLIWTNKLVKRELALLADDRYLVEAFQLQRSDDVELSIREGRLSYLHNQYIESLRDRSSADAADAALVNGPWWCTRCIDGDTIEVEIGNRGKTERVRLLNIDTPKRGVTGSAASTMVLESRVEGRNIELEFAGVNNPTRDRFGRVLAYVYVDGQLLNYLMIRDGFATFYAEHGEGQYARAMKYAEQKAKSERLGLHQ